MAFFCTVLMPAHASNFNLDTGFAANSSKYNKTLINAVEQHSDDIYYNDNRLPTDYISGSVLFVTSSSFPTSRPSSYGTKVNGILNLNRGSTLYEARGNKFIRMIQFSMMFTVNSCEVIVTVLAYKNWYFFFYNIRQIIFKYFVVSISVASKYLRRINWKIHFFHLFIYIFKRL